MFASAGIDEDCRKDRTVQGVNGKTVPTRNDPRYPKDFSKGIPFDLEKGKI
jgi:hypothetical protein